MIYLLFLFPPRRCRQACFSHRTVIQIGKSRFGAVPSVPKAKALLTQPSHMTASRAKHGKAEGCKFRNRDYFNIIYLRLQPCFLRSKKITAAALSTAF